MQETQETRSKSQTYITEQLSTHIHNANYKPKIYNERNTKKRKDSRHNTKDRHQIIREQKKNKERHAHTHTPTHTRNEETINKMSIS